MSTSQFTAVIRSAVPRHREVSGYLAKKICQDLGIPDPGETSA